MATQAARGKQLIEEKKFEEAVVALTAALKESPTSPAYLTQRALAYQRNKQYTEALADADAAVVFAHKRAKKELIIDAQVRRGVILYNLERYGDARAVLDVVKGMNKDVKEVGTWSTMIASKVKTLGEDHEKMKVTVKEVPDLDMEALKVGETGPTTSATNGATSTPAPAPIAKTTRTSISRSLPRASLKTRQWLRSLSDQCPFPSRWLPATLPTTSALILSMHL
jgi:suppressor of G2 allele of SKP1